MNLQKIGDSWKAHRKIYQMSPSASIYINFSKRYKQNKGIYAVLEKIQQPVPVGSLWPLIIWLYYDESTKNWWRLESSLKDLSNEPICKYFHQFAKKIYAKQEH